MSSTNPVEADDLNQDPVDNQEAHEELENEGQIEDKVAYSSYKKLLNEKKSLKKRFDELEAERKKNEDAKLLEEGKYKDLLESKEKELTELQGAAEERDGYREFFEKKLESTLEGLTDLQKKAVNGFNGTISEKLEMAEEFKGTVSTPSASSPGSSRPSANNDYNFDISEYLGPDGAQKRYRLKFTDEKKYQKVMEAYKRR